jgi:hypothetical protein
VKRSNGDPFAVLKHWPVANWEWPKIVLFVPMVAALPFADEVFFNFMEIAQGGVPFFKLPYSIPDVARNKAAQALRESEFTHVLMLDTDHPHPFDIVQRLARRVIEDPTRLIVAAMAFRRGEPYDPMAWVHKEDGFYYTIDDWEHGSIFECDVVATPAMLIHRDVFETVKYPWFFYEYLPEYTDGMRPTEDLGFCRKARAAGIKIYCDSSVITPHMRAVKVDEKTWETWKQMHPDKIVDPVIEKKAGAIAERLHLTPEQLEAKVQMASANVKASWDATKPRTREEVERWYGDEKNGYFYDLLAWNTTPLYKSIVEPLRSVKGKNVLVIGPGIGGEIDALIEGGNSISVHDVPGVLRDFVQDYYEGKIRVMKTGFMVADYKCYDLVIAVDVIEHIHPAGFEKFLEIIDWTLTPGGDLYCHNNFTQQDIYPMHYAENEQPFNEWVKENFKQVGELTYRKLPVKELA